MLRVIPRPHLSLKPPGETVLRLEGLSKGFGGG
jgi:hypothetical protein